jgi:diguanylate cyclase (GGDEF)-like protein
MDSGLDVTNRRILVVDDNSAIHEDFRKILASDRDSSDLDELEAALFGTASEAAPTVGYELDSALQGKEGVEKVIAASEAKQPYAVAFVDMRMPPGWDGVETIERLWEQDPDLQIVICTAYSDYSWREIVDRLGETDRLLILKKPFDSAEICQIAAAFSAKWQFTQQARMKIGEMQRLVDMQTTELRREIEARKKNEEELRAAKDALQFQATHDGVTGIMNRAAVNEILKCELKFGHRQQTPISVMFADIDHFKAINDTHGHQAGDIALRRVAEILKDSIRSMDSVGRYGGEEFLAVLPNCGSKDALHVAERARQHVSDEVFEFSDQEFDLSVSIGVTSDSGKNDVQIDELLKTADVALYRAKAEGRNRVEFEPLQPRSAVAEQLSDTPPISSVFGANA